MSEPLIYATWEEGDVVEIGHEPYDMNDASRVIAQLSREEARSLYDALRELLEPPIMDMRLGPDIFSDGKERPH